MFSDFFSAVHSLAEDITTLSDSGEIFDSSFFDLTSAEEFLLETKHNTSTANQTKSAATTQEEDVPPPSPDSDEEEEGDVFFDASENLLPPLPPPPPPTPPPPQRKTKEQIEAAIKSMIIIEKRKHAFPYAKFFDDDASPEDDDGSSSDSGNMDMSSHLVIWTDASWHKDFAGVGFVFRNQQQKDEKEWLEYGYTILPPFPKENFSYELLGIGLALKTAAEQVVASHSKRAPIKRVTIFNDSLDGIRKSEKHIRNYFGVPLFGPEQPVYGGGVQTLLTGAKSLEVLWDRGVEVEIRWSPGHCGIQGNERADEVAKLAARYGFTSLSLGEPESESSLPEPISLTESESLPEPSQSQSVKGDAGGLVDNNIKDVEEGLKEKNGNGNVKSSSIANLVAGYVFTALGLLASSPTPSVQVDSDSGTVVKDAGGLNGNGNGNRIVKPSTAKWVATLAARYIFTGLGLSTSSPPAQVVVADSPPGSGLEGDRGVDVDGTVKLGDGKGQVRAEAISGCSLPPTPPDSEGEAVVVSSIDIKKKCRGSRGGRKRNKGKRTDTSGTGTSSTETSGTGTTGEETTGTGTTGTGTSGTSSELAHDGSVPLPFWLRAPRDYTCSTISGSGSGEQQKQEPQTGEQPQQKNQQQQQVEVKEQNKKASPRKAKILRILMPSSGQQTQEKPQQQQQHQKQKAQPKEQQPKQKHQVDAEKPQQQEQQVAVKEQNEKASPSRKFKILRILVPDSGQQPQSKKFKQQQQQQAKKQEEDNKKSSSPDSGKVRIMRLPVPVLRVVDEMMHMVDGMNDRTAPVKKLKQTMARRAVGLLKKAGQEEGWMMDEHEI
ncbi:hypothetical protein V8F06_000523 [Rhypophila decipiens]